MHVSMAGCIAGSWCTPSTSVPATSIFSTTSTSYLSVDSVEARTFLIPELEARDLPFVDCGLGLRLVDDRLMGQVRVTTSTPAMRRHVHVNTRVPLVGGDDDDIYHSNIQVADLNRLAATLAVIQYKQLRGFYADTEAEYHSVYTVDGNTIVNADRRQS